MLRLILDAPLMREMSVAEQRYKAVLAVISDGRTVTEVAASWEVSRQTLHTWLARYEDGGLEALADRSHRPRSCPHQMDAVAQVAALEARRRHPGWGPRRIVLRRRVRAVGGRALGSRLVPWAGSSATLITHLWLSPVRSP